ncbi:hypothetical protein DB346_13050 [Verrucomicrobia bacterium LW23]|nr:hypothetical protein DB346_13050 [Verrucomicrobia bacterium LW23]
MVFLVAFILEALSTMMDRTTNSPLFEPHILPLSAEQYVWHFVLTIAAIFFAGASFFITYAS